MYAAHLSFSNNRPAKSALTDAKSARLAAAALLFCNIYVLLRALRHAFFDRSAGRRGGKASEHRLAELHRHAPPDLAHRVDDLIDGDAALDARERHIRRTTPPSAMPRCAACRRSTLPWTAPARSPHPEILLRCSLRAARKAAFSARRRRPVRSRCAACRCRSLPRPEWPAMS